MPPQLLQSIRQLPLEREHEGWITWQIKDYFESVGQTSCVWALSAAQEKIWNADEFVEYDGKIFGLQMKRTYLDDGEGREGFHMVKWELHNQSQFKAIKAAKKAVFYCLPTFTNRDWRKTSLHHAIFWHPTGNRGYNGVLWYDKPDENEWRHKIERDKDSYRWGNLIERIQHCTYGWEINNGKIAAKDLEELNDFWKAMVEAKKEADKKIKTSSSRNLKLRPTEAGDFFLVYAAY